MSRDKKFKRQRTSRLERHAPAVTTEKEARATTIDASRHSVSAQNASASARKESDSPPNDETLIYGIAPVLQILRAETRSIERITIAEGVHAARLHEVFQLARAGSIPIERAPRVVVERLAAGANHQGVVARVAAAHYYEREALLDELAARTGTNDPPLAIVLDGIEDPRNLGAILRTAECAGAHGVFIPERRAVGLTGTVAKTSAGALDFIPIARATNIARLADELKERGIWTVGASADAEQLYTDWDWTGACALFLGGEEAGLRRLVREHCDALVRIPLRGRTESLNVSVAAGILLYEIVRQRRNTPQDVMIE